MTTWRNLPCPNDPYPASEPKPARDGPKIPFPTAAETAGGMTGRFSNPVMGKSTTPTVNAPVVISRPGSPQPAIYSTRNSTTLGGGHGEA